MVIIVVLTIFSVSPPVAFILNQLLGIVTSLNIILHFLCIGLDYPLRMQLFFGGLFPLITFDAMPTDDLYNLLFSTKSFEDDEPLSEQFDIIGYSSRLVYDNLGSLLIFMFLQPALLIFGYFILWALKFTNAYPKQLDRLKTGIKERIKGFLSNGLVAFYLKNYLVLSVIGNITRKDFGSNTSLNYSSVLSVLLTAYSLAFPFLMTYLLGKKFVP